MSAHRCRRRLRDAEVTVCPCTPAALQCSHHRQLLPLSGVSVFISRLQATSKHATPIITMVTDVTGSAASSAASPAQPRRLPLVCHFPVNPPLPPSTPAYAQPANHRAGQRHSCRRGRQQWHLDVAHRGLGRRPWPVSLRNGGFRVQGLGFRMQGDCPSGA